MSIIGVKFAQSGKVFNVDSEIVADINDTIVVDTIRGLELGIVSKPSGEELTEEIKSVVRKATDADLKKMEELKKQESHIQKLTNELIAKYKLEMKLVDVNFTLDGTKVIINYVCEDRVDFRELVKDLASSLRARIELRQIGIRDQAKIIGGIGFCGKECCCKKYLNDFDKVSIKMAKTQGLSLNPTKISGICGRLMCCLAYENELYADISVKMPKLNSKVNTKDGLGTVVYNNILKQIVTVRVEKDGEIKVGEYALDEIEQVAKTVQNPPKQKENNIPKSQPKEEVKKESVTVEKEEKQNNTNSAEHNHKNKKKFKNFKKKNNQNNDKK
ncbi:MAG: stage 0 sporulation protein [Clostridiales bacterium]|nr:stage 0 sporulation protein [Clostridiales bacterium]